MTRIIIPRGVSRCSVCAAFGCVAALTTWSCRHTRPCLCMANKPTIGRRAAVWAWAWTWEPLTVLSPWIFSDFYMETIKTHMSIAAFIAGGVFALAGRAVLDKVVSATPAALPPPPPPPMPSPAEQRRSRPKPKVIVRINSTWPPPEVAVGTTVVITTQTTALCSERTFLRDPDLVNPGRLRKVPRPPEERRQKVINEDATCALLQKGHSQLRHREQDKAKKSETSPEVNGAGIAVDGRQVAL